MRVRIHVNHVDHNAHVVTHDDNMHMRVVSRRYAINAYDAHVNAYDAYQHALLRERQMMRQRAIIMRDTKTMRILSRNLMK